MPGPDVQHDPSLFGFAVRTEVPLQFLRMGGGVKALEIAEEAFPPERPTGVPLGEWPLHGTAYPATAALFQHPFGFEYWTSDAGRFRIDLEPGRIVVPVDGDPILREQRLHGMPMLLSFDHRGDFSLHAAAVQVGSGAVILAAPSRFGKTTLAFAFHRAGHRILSEDLVCCRPGSLEVLPGPALVRLRPDAYHGVPPAGMREVAARPDRIFLALEGESRGSGAPLPIRGVVFLREGASLRLEPAPVVDSIRDLWHLGFRIPTAEARAGSFQALAALAKAVPVVNLYRPLDLGRLDETVTCLVGEFPD